MIIELALYGPSWMGCDGILNVVRYVRHSLISVSAARIASVLRLRIAGNALLFAPAHRSSGHREVDHCRYNRSIP